MKGRSGYSETILPQGIVEIIFNLADPMVGQLPEHEGTVVAPLFFLQGWNSHVVNVHYAGQHHLFGIRLQPYMVKPLLGIQASECKNKLIDLSLLKPGFRSLWHRLNEAASFQERMQIIETEFPVLDDKICTRTQGICDLFHSDDDAAFASVEKVSQTVFYSTRQLNRKTKDLYGVCAEELVTYKKFRTAVHRMHAQPRSLTDVAYSAGFYDQAHFSRIFKNFTGITAKEYLARKSDVPFHLFS